MDVLIAKQGEFYESVQLKKPTIAEVFDLEQQTLESMPVSTEIPDLLKSEASVIFGQQKGGKRHTWTNSFKAMLGIDFARSIFWKQFWKFMLIFTLTIAQEIVFLLV